MTTTDIDSTYVIEMLERWNRKLAQRMKAPWLHHQVQMDSFGGYIENLKCIAALRRQQRKAQRGMRGRHWARVSDETRRR